VVSKETVVPSANIGRGVYSETRAEKVTRQPIINRV